MLMVLSYLFYNETVHVQLIYYCILLIGKRVCT